MKATLEFELPEEQEAYRATNNAIEYLSALMEIDNTIRSWIKHSDLQDDTYQKLKTIRGMIPDLYG